MLSLETNEELIEQLSKILKNRYSSFVCVLSAEKNDDDSYAVKYVSQYDSFKMPGDAWARYSGSIYVLRITRVDLDDEKSKGYYSSTNYTWDDELVKLFKRKPSMSPRGLWFMKSTSRVITTHDSLIFVSNRHPMGD